MAEHLRIVQYDQDKHPLRPGCTCQARMRPPCGGFLDRMVLNGLVCHRPEKRPLSSDFQKCEQYPTSSARGHRLGRWPRDDIRVPGQGECTWRALSGRPSGGRHRSPSERRSTTPLTSFRPIWILGSRNTTSYDPIAESTASGRPRRKPSSTACRWRKRRC